MDSLNLTFLGLGVISKDGVADSRALRDFLVTLCFFRVALLDSIVVKVLLLVHDSLFVHTDSETVDVVEHECHEERRGKHEEENFLLSEKDSCILDQENFELHEKLNHFGFVELPVELLDLGLDSGGAPLQIR